MGKIALLDAAVADQIAAGEVVERPASVVKELVENSLDAGAKRVDVEVEEAGRRLIRVSDDGEGMDAADLELAVSRHATSKIRSATDLHALASYGFRGEALPSIASVSRFRLLSRQRGAEAAHELAVEGGKPGQLKAAGRAPGTTVEVRELFYNVPARLKFLKAAATEQGRISSELQALALSHPATAFSLRQAGKTVFEFAAAKGGRERLAQAWGASFLDQALPVDHRESAGRVLGWIARPQFSRSNRTGQLLFINQRPVEHRSLGYTLATAYGSLMPHGRHAVAVLFLELPLEEVDVNVHPAKREVRFKDERSVLDLIRHGVGKALGEARLEAGISLTPSAGYGGPGPAPGLRGPAPDAPFYRPGASGQALLAPEAAQSRGLGLEVGSAAAPHQESSPWMTKVEEPVVQDWPQPLAQLHLTYLLCQDSGGLVLVDQHAAHERVLYERFLNNLGRGEFKVQRLLLPQRLQLGPAQAAQLNEWLPWLGELGLEATDGGGGLFFIQSLPDFLKGLQVGGLLNDLLESPPGAAEDPALAFQREAAARMACRAAVKAGDALNLEEMHQLMADLSRCAIPWSCPHGRPPLVRLSLAELEKHFLRR